MYRSTIMQSRESEMPRRLAMKSNKVIMKGSFEFTATDDDKEVEITGNFHAKKGSVLNVDIF